MKRIEVAAGLVFRDGRLLITQRPPGSHLEGLWEFPGGKCEPRETLEACLARELSEELGVTVHVGERVAEISHDYPDKQVRLHFFLCRLIAGEPLPIQCAAVAWVSAEELSGYEFPAADAGLIERLKSETPWWRQAGGGGDAGSSAAGG